MNNYLENRKLLSERSYLKESKSLAEIALKYSPTEDLKEAINTVIDSGRPLLVVGDMQGNEMYLPAYYTATRLELEPVITCRINENTTIEDLMYHFDNNKYKEDLQLSKRQAVDKRDYIQTRALWDAMVHANRTGFPSVLLIEGIDKAQAELQDDLLFELNLLEVKIKETGDIISCPNHLRPITFVTCNRKEGLSDSFISRCEVFVIKDEIQSIIFLSYAREDIGIAEKLYKDLVEKNYNVWWDEEALLPGQTWDSEIREAISKCTYFITLISSQSLSKKRYVQKETKLALDVLKEIPDSQVFIIPVRLDDCNPKDHILESLHWADLFPEYEKGLNKILRVLGKTKLF